MLKESARHYKYGEDLKRGRTHKTFQYMSNNDVFKLTEDICKVLIMSDIHSATPFVVCDLVDSGVIDQETIALTCGDMAGNGKMGGNADPIAEYKAILDAAHRFYFVQGNHDVYYKEALHLKNSDGTYCCVDGRLVNTPLGTITGVSGIIGNSNPELHIYDAVTYREKYRKAVALQPDILLTHQPPPEPDVDKHKYTTPLIQICGHWHAEDDAFQILHNGILRINSDNRILYIH